MEMDYVAVLEAKSLKSRHRRGHVPVQAQGRIAPCSLPRFEWSPGVFGALVLSVHHFSVWLSSRGVLSPFVLLISRSILFSVCVSRLLSSYKGTRNWVLSHRNPAWPPPHLVTSGRPIFKWDLRWDSEILGEHEPWGRAVFNLLQLLSPS